MEGVISRPPRRMQVPARARRRQPCLTLAGGLAIPWPMDTPRRPTLTDKALAEKAAREAREAAALRANLLRRKQQQREREQAERPPAPPKDGP